MGQIIKDAIHHNVSFWVCLIVALFLIIGGAITPPLFAIDGSIFIAVGELWLFAALGAFIKALDRGKDAKITRGDMSLTIGDLNEKEE